MNCKHPAVLSLLGLAACATTNPPQVEDTLIRSGEFGSVQVVNVAALPIQDLTGAPEFAPLKDYMRHAVNMGLQSRRYSPLNPTYVDAHLRPEPGASKSIVEPMFLSTLANKADEDAILAVQVTAWDESRLLVDNRVRFEANLTMLGSKGRKVLWSGGLKGEVVAGGDMAAPRDPAERRKAAVDVIVQEMLRRLPKRES